MFRKRKISKSLQLLQKDSIALKKKVSMIIEIDDRNMIETYKILYGKYDRSGYLPS